jgi:hypothetical protein
MAMNATEAMNVIEAMSIIEAMNITKPMPAAEIAARAKDQLSALTGLKASTVSSLSHDEKGWHIVADMIELKRIPEASDVLATYEVNLDEDGNLLSYQRTRRYTRGQITD